MAALILPSRRVVQPQGPVEVDWGNPLARGLFVAASGASKPYGFDLPAGLTRVARRDGFGITTPSLTAYSAPLSKSVSGSNWTLLSVAQRPTTTTTYSAIWGIFGSATERITQHSFIFSSGNFGTDARPYKADASSGILLPTQQVYVVATVIDSNANVIKQYVRGTAVNQQTLTATTAITVNTVDIFSKAGLDLGQPDSSILLLAGFARALSDGEIGSLFGNPWQLFRPIQRRIWVPVVGGGGDVTGSLNATEAGSDTFASSGTVLVSGALSVTESGSDTFSSSGAVVVSGSLAVTESGPDTFSATGTTTGGVSGSLDATEAGSDTAAVSGVVLVAGSLAVTESGEDTFAASGAVVATGLLSATESGPDTFSALGVTASVNGSLNATEQGSDTAEIRSSEQQGEGRGFVMLDRPSALWWKRKPKALSDEVAEQKVERVVRVIKEIAGKKQPEQTAKQAQRQVAQAIAPMLADMPGFDWTPLYRTIVAEFQRQREEAARIEAVAQIARIRAIEQDDEDVLILLMSL